MIMKKILLITVFSIVLLKSVAQEKSYSFCLNNELILLNEDVNAAYSVYDINTKKITFKHITNIIESLFKPDLSKGQ